MDPMNPENEDHHIVPGGEETLVRLERMIDTLGRNFASPSGFMWTDTGFEVLHAEWPAYPQGDGIGSAVRNLAEFPRGTKFFPVDNIDQCTLFVIGEKPEHDPYGRQYLHVAAWDDDLRAAASARCVDGIVTETEHLTFPNGYIELTEKGVNRSVIDVLLGQVRDILDPPIVHHLYEGRYATAVREASLRVEMALRRASALSDFGRRLVDKCFGEDRVLVPPGIANTARQTVLNAFRAYFTFVRNEYAHGLPAVDMLTASILVRRSGELLTVIEAMSRGRRT